MRPQPKQLDPLDPSFPEHKNATTQAWERAYRHSLFVTSTAHSCLNCEHWLDDGQICGLFKIRPPAEVIVFSCGESWEDQIPF